MKKTVMALLLALAPMISSAVTDVYKIKLSLNIPQVVDNMQSLGKREYKKQHLTGTLKVKYREDGSPEVTITGLSNSSYKVNGVPVQYKVYVDEYVLWNLIGSNKTGKFKKPSVSFSFEAQPSYLYSYKPSNDNSLVLTLSGKGSSRKLISGYVSGTQGCGCMDYGHTSPTRIMGAFGIPLDIVNDIAAVYGTWKIKLQTTTKD